MANTFVAIAKSVLTTNQSTVTFSTISGAYSDLVIIVSARSDRAASLVDTITLNINGSTTNFSNRRIEGTGATGATTSNTTNSSLIRVPATSVTADAFTSAEIYLSNYAAAYNKTIMGSFAYENNTTTAYSGATAGLWRDTSTITSIVLGVVDGTGFVTGSRFDLYGISKT